MDACRYYTGLIFGALRGAPKADLLAPSYSPIPGLWDVEPLHPTIATIAAGSFRTGTERDLPASGYVAHTLEATLWAFHTTDSFDAGALAAVNLGADADTTGAVFGQLAGAYYGAEAIPVRWRELIVMREHIEKLARQLMDASSR